MRAFRSLLKPQTLASQQHPLAAFWQLRPLASTLKLASVYVYCIEFASEVWLIG